VIKRGKGGEIDTRRNVQLFALEIQFAVVSVVGVNHGKREIDDASVKLQVKPAIHASLIQIGLISFEFPILLISSELI
jgi:hypothetical protein